MRKTFFISLLLIVGFLLTGCTHDRIRYENVLNQAEKQNVDYDSITNFDSIKMAVKFMDANGSNNERIRAHYLLGCAYRDMGEAPLALESYQNAADCADTTQSDCDYRQLTRIHGQMASLFYQQLLPYEHLAEQEQQYKYAMLAKDTLIAINAIEHKADAYELLNLSDSIISVRLSAYKKYMEKNYTKEAASAVGPVIIPLLDAGRINEARYYQDIYESRSGFWKNGKIEKRKILYYYTKGLYYLTIGNNDSAKVFFQRLLSPYLTANHWEAGYRGLYLLYKKIGQKDSLAKYADLCYQLNDASYSSEATRQMQQMQALYNYTRSQKEASKMKEKVDRNKHMLMAALVVLILVLAIGSYIYQKRRKATEILYLHYKNAKDNLEKAKREQIKMKEENSSLLEEKNNEILLYEQQILDYESRLKIERKKVTNEELMTTPIYNHFKYVLAHPMEKLQKKDWRDLRSMIDEKIPGFYSELHTSKARLQQQDYDICILVRLYFTPSEIAVLTNNTPSSISMKRIRLLKRIYGIDGAPEDFDKRIQSIC